MDSPIPLNSSVCCSLITEGLSTASARVDATLADATAKKQENVTLQGPHCSGSGPATLQPHNSQLQPHRHQHHTSFSAAFAPGRRLGPAPHRQSLALLSAPRSASLSPVSASRTAWSVRPAHRPPPAAVALLWPPARWACERHPTPDRLPRRLWQRWRWCRRH